MSWGVGDGVWTMEKRFDDAFDGVHGEWLRDKIGPRACLVREGKGRTFGDAFCER